jgi:hypothetical protein
MIGYSFVQSATDVALLQDVLAPMVLPNRFPLALVLNIETKCAKA